MQGHLQEASAEERAEIEAIVGTIGPSSRLGKLLLYIGERYFAGEYAELSEYAIATEVFGRSKSTFDPSEDAIARIELHRLRKRLKEFYEGAGKDRPLQISIPPGTYAPSFTKRVVELPKTTTVGTTPRDAESAPAPTPVPAFPATSGRNSRIGWTIAAIAAVFLITAAGIYFFRAPAVAGRAAPPLPASQSNFTAPTGSAVRILCGYSGAPRTDSAGAQWGPDRFDQSGGAWHRLDDSIARTSDPFLFENWRAGDSFYDIPLLPGIYELHLYFVAPGPSGDHLPTFSVEINGKLTLQGFDIDSDALGTEVADERVFRDVSPAADGKLHIDFTSERGTPRINAIEVVPGLPHKTLPIRLTMQHASYTDSQGRFWRADNYFMGGMLSDRRQEVTGPSDRNLFSTERYGHFTYAIPVEPRDRYTLVLHFAEFYFGPNASGGGGIGSRVFKVMCNGRTLLDNFDIYKEAGSLHELTKTFHHIDPSAQGKLNLTFEPITNNATISGIEVLDESR